MSDLTVDTVRLHQAAGHLDEAVAALRRADDRPVGIHFDSTAFGTSGAALEAADRLERSLMQGAECGRLLASRAARLGDALRTTAAQFDATESALAGGPR